jgi:hypothetical protein
MKTFKQFLNEMSAKIQHVGNFSGPTNMYHQGDDKIITRGAVKAEKLWEKSKGNFKLIFINDPSFTIPHIAPIGGGRLESREIEKIAEFFKKHNQEFQTNQNEITVIYTRNDFQSKPMTAWIMAHRFGHMISYYIEEIIKEIKFTFYMNFIADKCNIKVDSLQYKLATMKSAREGQLTNIGELYHEFMAQYLITGKVTLNSLDAVVDTSNINPKRLAEMQNMIPKLNADMNSKFGELLDSFHGKVFML